MKNKYKIKLLELFALAGKYSVEATNHIQWLVKLEVEQE